VFGPKMKKKKVNGVVQKVKVNTGALVMDNLNVERRFSFLDFIRGGTVITPIIAVDMTRGNLDPRHAVSLHHLGGDCPNDYATTIKAVCEVLKSYQGIGPFLPGGKRMDALPIYGFGAKIPPCKARCSNCFSLTGDFLVPFAQGIEGAVEAYQNSVRVNTLHGPTKLQEIIELAANWARPYADAEALDDVPGPNKLEQRYFVLTIISNGGVEDQQATLNAIAEAVGLPLSIIVVGVGNKATKATSDHSFFETLNDEAMATQTLNLKVSCRMGHECRQMSLDPKRPDSRTCSECHCKVGTCPTCWHCETCGQRMCEKCGLSIAQKMANGPVHRDMVTFKKFNQFRGRPHDLAAEALAKLPHDLVDYYRNLEVQPRGQKKFETDQGLPKPRDKVVQSGAAKQRAKAMARSNLKHGKGKAVHKSASQSPSSQPSISRTATHLSSNVSESGASVASKSTLRSHAMTTVSSTSGDTSLSHYGTEVAEEAPWDPSHLVPPFLRQRRREIFQAAEMLGYRNYDILRCLENGVAEDSIEALVDCIVHASTLDGLACYKDAAKEKKPTQPIWQASSEASHLTSRYALEDSLVVEDVLDDESNTSGEVLRSSGTLDSYEVTSYALGSYALGSCEVGPIGSCKLGSLGEDEKSFSLQGTQESFRTRSQSGTKETELKSSLKGSKELSLRGSLRRGSADGTKETLRSTSTHSSKERYGSFSQETPYRSLSTGAGSKERTGSVNFDLPGDVGDNGRLSEETLCTICYEQPINVELLPCRHRVACEQCLVQAGSLCPLCRTFVVERQLF